MTGDDVGTSSSNCLIVRCAIDDVSLSCCAEMDVMAIKSSSSDSKLFDILPFIFWYIVGDVPGCCLGVLLIT